MDIKPFLTIDEFKAEKWKGCRNIIKSDMKKEAVASYNSRVRKTFENCRGAYL
jgi:hypothetical protein